MINERRLPGEVVDGRRHPVARPCPGQRGHLAASDLHEALALAERARVVLKNWPLRIACISC